MTQKTYTFSYMDEPQNSFLHWAMVTFPGMSDLPSTEFIDQLSSRSDNLDKIELQIHVNGLEVNAKAFMERIEQAMDWAVDHAVKEKLSGMTGFEELHDSISEFESGFKRKVRELAKDNGIEMNDDGYW